MHASFVHLYNKVHVINHRDVFLRVLRYFKWAYHNLNAHWSTHYPHMLEMVTNIPGIFITSLPEAKKNSDNRKEMMMIL